MTIQLNRHARRAMKHDLDRAGYATPANGLRHDELTKLAFELLVEHLRSNGNQPNEAHLEALYALVGLITQMAQHKLTGRYAFGLPTGMGKTSAIIAWCAALHRLGHDHISVAVSASKVEALCDLKRSLIRAGVPEGKIGLLYADGGRYSEPRTDDNDDRPIMLVSHARVRMGTGLARFNTYRGRPRDVLTYDESLLASDAKGIAVRELESALGGLEPLIRGRHGAAELVAYLRTCVASINDGLGRAKAASAPVILRLPAASEAVLSSLPALLPQRGLAMPIRTLFEIGSEELRVVSTSSGGAVWYEVAVPTELRNVLILDASYTIRELCKADRSIKDAEAVLPPMRSEVPLARLKDYGGVVIHQWFRGGGRESMERDYTRPDRLDRHTTNAVIEVVNAIPEDQAVLVFVFKQRAGGPDFTRLTLTALEQAGIDTRAKVPVTINGVVELRDRINVATWGMETSLNCWAYVPNVILAGVLQRSTLDLAGAYLGQVDDLRSKLGTNLISTLARSEVCHAIYQALSRGTCRLISDGKAGAMRAWVIHRDIGIQAVLDQAMPGVRWAEWRPSCVPATASTCSHIIAKTSKVIAGFLVGLPEGTDRVSVRELKKATGLQECPNGTFQPARDAALAQVPWRLEGRSFVRLFPAATFR